MSKAIDELSFPENLKYAEDHEWARSEGETITIGITDYAQDQLGEIVYIEIPEVGDTFDQNDEFGSLESVKAVSEMYIPVGGEIAAVNEELGDAPELVNDDPYGRGWIVVIKPSAAAEMDALISKEAYLEILKGSE